jgi:hypothetical protein
MADILDLIRQRAAAAGVDPATALTIARIESNFDPTSNMNRATQYKGLFQLGRNEWATHGSGDIYDPTANTDAFLKLYNNNASALAKSLGRAPTPQEAYLAHQQGVTGATALLSNPDKNAVDVIAPFYKNRATALSAIKGNGGDPNGTAGDFVNAWTNKYNTYAANYGGGGNNTATASAPAGTGNSTLPMFAQAGMQPQVAAANTASAANSTTAQPTKDFNFAGLASSGLGLMAAGAPRQTWTPSSTAPPVHQAQAADLMGILAQPTLQTDDMKRRYMMGLLG